MITTHDINDPAPDKHIDTLSWTSLPRCQPSRPPSDGCACSFAPLSPAAVRCRHVHHRPWSFHMERIGTSWNTYAIWISLKVSNIPTNLPTIPNMSQHNFLENGIDAKPSTKAPSHGRTWAVGTALLQRYCWPAQLCLGFWDDKGTTRGNHRTPHDRRNIKQLKSNMEEKNLTLMGSLRAKLAKYGEVLKKKGNFLHFKRLLHRMKAWNTTNWKVIECHKDPLWVSLWFPLRQGEPESPEVILSMNDSVLASWD